MSHKNDTDWSLKVSRDDLRKWFFFGNSYLSGSFALWVLHKRESHDLFAKNWHNYNNNQLRTTPTTGILTLPDPLSALRGRWWLHKIHVSVIGSCWNFPQKMYVQLVGWRIYETASLVLARIIWLLVQLTPYSFIIYFYKKKILWWPTKKFFSADLFAKKLWL